MLLRAVIFLIVFNVGCASLTRPQLDENINYQRDINFKIYGLANDKAYNLGSFSGVAVAPLYSKYKITVFPPGKADMITITSCHREIKKAKPKKGWFEKGYTFSLEVMHGIEDNMACPFDIGIYEKKGGRHGWAQIVLENKKRYTLGALGICNGVKKQYSSVSICQAKEGLIQQYKFDRPTALATTKGCEIEESKDGMFWQFKMPKGNCTLYFIDKMNPDNFHQANFFGYSVIPIRGVE